MKSMLNKYSFLYSKFAKGICFGIQKMFMLLKNLSAFPHMKIFACEIFSLFTTFLIEYGF